MPEHTTCYTNTFITIAPDSSAAEGVVPPCKEANPSVAWRVPGCSEVHCRCMNSRI